MPIQNRDDAVEVEERISRIFAASPGQRAAAVRGLFVEVLDFNTASGQVSLAGATGNIHLPAVAERVAEMDGVHVLFIALPASDTDRVRKAVVDAAAKLLADQLGDDLLLVFTNPSATQLHIILPTFAGARPTLRRMVVERYLPRRTAVQQVSNIYWNYRSSRSIRTALDQAFDVEPVTRQFFGEYKRVFEATEQSVTGFPDTEVGKENRRSFVQTLFNRLMFVYFLSRKGWLTFQGSKDYLNVLWQDYHPQPTYGNFYTTRLQPLFFSGLNNPDSRNLTRGLATLIGDVPFLNGGLFEQTELDRREGITVPDTAIAQVLSGLFDRFNFTVMESTPYDQEVAVDPEMLGKVFEETVNYRHDSGAYYTPRPVVSFMCREALKGYLEGQDTGLTSEAVARFVDAQETCSIQVAQARRIADALAQVTVVDPACGSGAYLLGMMQELIELQTALYNAGVDARALYDLKLEIIQRNLYGVDLDDFAVNIAMLRLWLSLSIDYEGEKPEPLPNLDFKVLCGDSLLGPDPSAGVEVQGTLGQDTEQFRRLGQLKADFMRASPGPGKERLKGEIGELNTGIRQALGVSAISGVVDWRVEFAEVFAQRRGFDIAIANPPYINVETLTAETKAHLFANYATCEGRTDIYVAFLERSLGVLNSNGLLSFIIPASLTKQKYATKMRQKLIEQHSIRQLIDASSYRIFDAVVYNVVLTVGKAKRGNLTQVRIHTSNDDFENFSGAEFSVEQSLFASLKDSRFDTNPSIAKIIELKHKIWRNAIRFDRICFVAYGARLNHRTRKIGKDNYISRSPISGGKPFCEGRSIERYSFSQAGWLNYKPEEHYNPMFPELFEHPKLMFIRIVKDNLRFAYDDCGYYNSHTVINCVRLDLLTGATHRSATSALRKADLELARSYAYKFLLGVLNSTFINWYFLNFLSDSLNFYPNDAKELPIPPASDEQQAGVVKLVDQILAAKSADAQADTGHLERTIDELVYELYGLTGEETTAIERSLGLIHATDAEEDAALARMMEEYGPYGPEDLVSEETIRATLGTVDGG